MANSSAWNWITQNGGDQVLSYTPPDKGNKSLAAILQSMNANDASKGNWTQGAFGSLDSANQGNNNTTNGGQVGNYPSGVLSENVSSINSAIAMAKAANSLNPIPILNTLINYGLSEYGKYANNNIIPSLSTLVNLLQTDTETALINQTLADNFANSFYSGNSDTSSTYGGGNFGLSAFGGEGVMAGINGGPGGDY